MYVYFEGRGIDSVRRPVPRVKTDHVVYFPSVSRTVFSSLSLEIRVSGFRRAVGSREIYFPGHVHKKREDPFRSLAQEERQ